MRKLMACLMLYSFCMASGLEMLNERMQENHKKYAGFCEALFLLDERGGKVLVETGSTGHTDGETILFGNWAYENKAMLYCVDDCKERLLAAKKMALPYLENIECIFEDPVVFLKKFPLQIDFLYINSKNFDPNQPEVSQQYHLEELLEAMSHFTENTIVMVDECGLPHGGKGKLVIEYLTQNGWKIVMHGYQVILVKG